MRRGNNTKRPRSHPRSNGRKPPNPNRALESNTPDGVKVRGNPSQLYERYSGLARDAQSSGDRVSAEALELTVMLPKQEKRFNRLMELEIKK